MSFEPCCYRSGCSVVVTNDDYGSLCETCESGLWPGVLGSLEVQMNNTDLVCEGCGAPVLESDFGRPCDSCGSNWAVTPEDFLALA